MKNLEREILTILANSENKRNITSLTEDHFSSTAGKVIFRGIMDLHKKKIVPDMITLSEYLNKTGNLERAGGSSPVSDLYELYTTDTNFSHHEKILIETKQRERLKQYLRKAISDIEKTDPGAIIDSFLTDSREIIQSGSRTGFVKIGDAGQKWLVDVMNHKGKPHGIQTGFKHLDNLTGGIVPGELWIIAGRPSEGKTTLAGNIACNMADNGCKVGFVSTEMTPEQIAGRLILSGTQTDNSRIINGLYNETDYEALEIRAEDLNKLPLFVYPPDSQADFDKVFSLIRAEIYGKGLKVVIIDYIQNIFSHKHSETRNIEISRFMASLKSLALETNVGFIVLSQLNRDAISGRVGLHHLRDSGSIEQASDNVLILENPNGWNRDEQIRYGLNVALNEGLRILTIAKSRNTKRGDSIRLYLDGEHFQFKEGIDTYANLPTDETASIPAKWNDNTGLSF